MRARNGNTSKQGEEWNREMRASKGNTRMLKAITELDEWFVNTGIEYAEDDAYELWWAEPSREDEARCEEIKKAMIIDHINAGIPIPDDRKRTLNHRIRVLNAVDGDLTEGECDETTEQGQREPIQDETAAPHGRGPVKQTVDNHEWRDQDDEHRIVP